MSFVQSDSKESFQWELLPLRESTLLGKKMRFERSTALGFSIDTFLRVITGKPLRSHLEKNDYTSFLALHALDLSHRNGSVLQKRTNSELRKKFDEIRTPSGISLGFEGLEGIPANLSTLWRLARRSFYGCTDRTGQRLLARLAYYDRLTVEFTRSRHMPDRMERIKSYVVPSIDFWSSFGLRLRWEAIAVLDSTLQHLAWLDLKLLSGDEQQGKSSSLHMTIPKKRPIRHWFDRLLEAMDCDDLLKLHELLVRRNATRYSNVISHDLLKQWASSQRAFPYTGAVSLMTACYGEGARSVELMVFCRVKILVFLTEFVCCFSAEAIDPLIAQSYIHQRLELLLKNFEQTKGTYVKPLFVV